MNYRAHSFVKRGLVSLAAAAVAAGCGGGTSGTGGTSSTGTGGASSSSSGGNQGSVILSVNMATSPSKIGVLAPAAGRSFVEINITLQDVSTPSPIPVAFAYFTLSTANGLVLTPSVASSAVSVLCPTDISIAAGSQFTCDVAFEVPSEDSAQQLTYDDQNGHTATAPVSVTPPPPPDPCETVLTWHNEQSTACKQCEQTVCKTTRDAWLAELADGQTCPNQSTCISSTCTSANQCACIGECLGACKPAWHAYLNCAIANCSAACM